jgi:ubiquinone/menaquinone biosynthesis C-methylase UbiE
MASVEVLPRFAFEEFETQAMQRMAQECKTILDVGGGTRFMKRMQVFETLFANTDYKTLDISADYKPDIVGDIHRIPLADNSVDGVMCRSVLEHVERPADAVKEMHRILRPGGLAFIQVPSTYPYHARTGFGAYPDYWRFFDDTLKLLFAEFSEVKIQKHGGWFAAMSFFAPMQVRFQWFLKPVSGFLDQLFGTNRRTTTPFYSVLAKK